ncbi:polysaccharide deacetylase family protein [Litorimonas haliclonae]|uniref:polysaccharide deacetylase family protein n=1 Tax=Litorimonas haliclonae TaxID=2081977 RepID=UPI0039F0B991
MSLPDNYLIYPKRGYGQDHELYDWRQAKDRTPLAWDGGAKLAVQLIVPLEFFPLNPSGSPFKHPGAMATPYPDLRHFTVRDYGNRVGVFRLLESLNECGLKASFTINGEVAKRYPPLLEAVQTAGHEVVAHGLSTNHIHHEGLSLEEELELVKETLACFEEPPKGWMSPARNQSSRTLGLLAKAGVEYCLDWEMENAPVAAKTPDGPMTLLPNNYELSDFTLLHTRRQTEESWLTQMKEACDFLITEHERFGGQCLGLTLTPYILGQPFRIWALREFLTYIADHADIAVMTGSELTQNFREQIK